VPPEGIAGAVRRFEPVPHRLQTVLDRDGVLWIDDSKATNADAAMVALRSFGARPVVWIGGGRTKGVGADALATEVARRSRHAILNGETAAELDTALSGLGYAERTVVSTLRDAVIAARDIVRRGDVVLLAPGYTSFDQFTSFEERGDAFAALVRELVAAAAPRPDREPAAAGDGNGR